MKRRIAEIVTSLCLFCVLSFLVYAQETFTLVTYYPAPFGVYRVMRILGQHGEEILLREDPNNSNAQVLISDAGPQGVMPYLGFQNNAGPTNAGGMPDFYAQLRDDNNLWIVGGAGATHNGPSIPTGVGGALQVSAVGPGTVSIGSYDNSNPRNIIPGVLRAGEIVICGQY